MNMPHLLKYGNETILLHQLFDDLQMDRILSEETIAVLQKPCSKEEILCRQEVFELLDNPVWQEKIKYLYTALRDEERVMFLWRESEIPLERYHLRASLFSSHIHVCTRLEALAECGKLLSEVVGYFSSEEKRQLLMEMQNDYVLLTSLFEKMHSGLLSFSNKNWITPNYEAVCEYDTIADCAAALGFSVPDRKEKNVRVDTSFSDAIFRLYGEEVKEIERILGKYDDAVFAETVAYIPEIRFFLEIHDLIQKSAEAGIPHCIPEIADSPRFAAKDIYDISLLAKNCENIIPNDVNFTEAEPFFFLIGANGGGKTTYLRAVGINLLLFHAGCPIFAKKASVYPFAFTASHFPKDERFDNTGRLDEERKRTEEIFVSAQGKKAFLLFNETYSGTDDKRGFSLLMETAGQVRESGHFGLYVTHFHEVMNTEYPILSAEVDTTDENKRTYRIVKMKGNASSYAADILKKYRLDKESLQKRRDEHGHSTAESV